MISLDTILTEVVEPVLNTTGYYYALFTDAGFYQKATRRKNEVTYYINTLAEMTDYASTRISNGALAVAQSFSVRFMLPIDDEPDATGNYPAATAFRDALTQAFSKVDKFSLTVTENDVQKTYSGGLSFFVPIRGERGSRTNVGDSIEYRATLQVSYLENGINATDVVFSLDGTVIPYTQFVIRRTPSATAVLTPDETNGEGKVYNEVTSLTVDIQMPLLSDSAPSASVVSYLLGLSSMNETMTLTIAFPGITPDFSEEVIFGECTTSGEGVGNVAAMIRLVPAVVPNMEA